ncbi:AAC(3) family N-acetyltransferase [Campylobacter volucris]|uniref:AAC(3) family N-acetyltransferase n=1 Tax=Campylobacter volucris TaxID=1031542 RepID=UPI00189F2B6F|nr:AAC(3) family N-acetyltransferase [Campylobacter volucris]MBF7046023.1 AAC(3) family N-acetyltransferase [Campylobacter volucris]
MQDYKLNELGEILQNNIQSDNEVVFIAGNLANFGRFDSNNKKDLLELIVEKTLQASAFQTTIMTQTMSFQICNTDIPYERNTWANLGSFGNYLLNLKDSIRSNHPFASYTAYGKNANICNTTTPFSYGLNSPYDNMLKKDNILMISMGMTPNLTCSLVHQAEFNMHVPYRYIKEFYHPIKDIDGKITYKNFYMHVLYEEYIQLKRNLNVKFFEYFKNKYKNSIKEIPLGKNSIYIYNYKDFYFTCIECLTKDIYYWMNEEPKIKPYRR